MGSLVQWIPDIQLEQVRLQVAKSFAEVFEVDLVPKTRTIQVIDYDPQWAIAFNELKQVLWNKLDCLVQNIEHVGSTSIPGLAAKPIIDIDIIIESDRVLPTVISYLQELGYLYEGDLGIKGREAFARKSNNVPYDGTGKIWQNHHLYVCPQDSEALVRHLTFRDYLRSHSEERMAYGELKRQLAQKFPYDLDAYLEGKSPFVERLMQRIRQV